jgi:hypothetical protein
MKSHRKKIHRQKSPVANFTRKKRPSHKFKTEWCDDKMTFNECELAIVRHAVDVSDERKGARAAQSETVGAIMSIVEKFIGDKRLVCYGGTAINNILPKDAQFYNRNVQIPDYDFFSKTAYEHAIELANLYYKAGYDEVEAKSGVHAGTFKVFVNYIPVADITHMQKDLFASIQKEAIERDGILYAPPNYLRMSMFLELSRPEGDTSRWEKVLKRLTLLNEHYPLTVKGGADTCQTIDFQRPMSKHAKESERLYYTVRDSFISQGVVFFGGYASSIYSRYMPQDRQHLAKNVPDFDVLAEDPEECAMEVKEQLKRAGFRKIKIVQHTGQDEVIPDHVEIIVQGETLAFVYRPVGCHNYNTIQVGGETVHIATIDTMLSFYLAFLYANKPYYDKARILCMSMFLFDVEQENRLQQRGVLKRFSMRCYGKQQTLDDLRAEKAEMYEKLKKQPESDEYKKLFLKYAPAKNPELKGVTRKVVEKTAEAATRKRKTIHRSKVLDASTKTKTSDSDADSDSVADSDSSLSTSEKEDSPVRSASRKYTPKDHSKTQKKRSYDGNFGKNLRQWFQQRRKENGFYL